MEHTNFYMTPVFTYNDQKKNEIDLSLRKMINFVEISSTVLLNLPPKYYMPDPFGMEEREYKKLCKLVSAHNEVVSILETFRDTTKTTMTKVSSILSNPNEN